MKIFVKDAAIKHQIQKEVAKPAARQELEETLRAERAKLSSHNIQDKAEVRKEIKKWEKTLERTRPETLSPSVKNTMWKRAKELKDQFTIGMLSRDELHPVKSFEHNGAINVVVNEDKMASVNSVSRQYAWNKKMGAKVSEYKNIMRHLNPDDPNASDIERFRPSGRIK